MDVFVLHIHFSSQASLDVNHFAPDPICTCTLSPDTATAMTEVWLPGGATWVLFAGSVYVFSISASKGIQEKRTGDTKVSVTMFNITL